MKAFVAIVALDGDKVAKYQDFDTQAEADAHVEEHGGFVVEGIDGDFEYWYCDPVARTAVKDTAAQDAAALARKWSNVRRNRDQLLKDSDFTQLEDSQKDKQAWKTYRVALRDITEQPDPDSITWPETPA